MQTIQLKSNQPLIKRGENMENTKHEAMNKLNAWLNHAVPMLRKELEKGYKLNADGNLCKKDNPRFYAILATAPYRAYINFSDISVWLKSDICYKTGDYSCNYFKRDIWLFNPKNQKEQYTYTFKTDYTQESIINAENELKNLEYTKRDIEGAISDLKHEFQF